MLKFTSIQFNTQPPIKLDSEVNLDQTTAKLILDFLHSDFKPSSPIVVMGEVNSTPITLEFLPGGKYKINGEDTENIWQTLKDTYNTPIAAIDINYSVVGDDLTKEEILQLLSSLVPVSEALQITEELRAKVQELGGAEGVEYLENEQRIFGAEARLNSQKESDEAVLAVGDFDTEISQSTVQLQQISHVTTKIDHLKTNMEKFKHMEGKDLDSDAEKLKSDIQKIREDQLTDEVEKYKLESNLAMHRDELQVSPTGKMANFLIIMAILTIGAGILGYAVTSNWLTIVVAIIGCLVQLILWWVLNKISPEVIFNYRRVAISQSKGGKLGIVGRITEQIWQRLGFLERFFVDKAWVGALRQESELLQGYINTSLDGKNPEELLAKKKDLTLKKQQLLNLSKVTGGKEISPEEYLKLRREVDNYKIEKLRMEKDLEAKEYFPELLTTIAKGLGKSDQKYVMQGDNPFSFASVNVANDDVIFQDAQGNIVPLDKIDSAELLALMLHLKLRNNSPAPIFIVNILAKLNGKLADYVRARIEEVKTTNQIVVMNLHS